MGNITYTDLKYMIKIAPYLEGGMWKYTFVKLLHYRQSNIILFELRLDKLKIYIAKFTIGPGKLQPVGQIWHAACFCTFKVSVEHSYIHSFT